MEDVSFPISSALFLASIVIDHKPLASRRAKVASIIMSLAACAILFISIPLPISREVVKAILAVIIIGWLGLIISAIPTVLRTAKASARE